MIRILGIGDIVGKPGREALSKLLPQLLKSENIDFVVANAENASGGSGVTPKEADELFAAGINVITTGDHVWARKEIIPVLETNKRILRLANYPEEAPGSGFGVYETAGGARVGVIHVAGRVFMRDHFACPFKTARALAEQIKRETPVVVVDMHAEATSEKVAIGWHLDGLASFVFGTHTHVQTADERILPNGTAYITDLGMTGPYESVIGRRVDKVLQKMITQVPNAMDVAENDVKICGAIADIDTTTGAATTIRRVCVNFR